MARSKTNTQKAQNHAEHQDAPDIQNEFCVFRIFIYL